MRILTRVHSTELREMLRAAATRLGAEHIEALSAPSANGGPGGEWPAEGGEAVAVDEPPRVESVLRAGDILVAEVREDEDARFLQELPHTPESATLVVCRPDVACRLRSLAEADEWMNLPADAEELDARLETAQRRAAARTVPEEAATAQRIRYQELLYDRLTGFPTLPVMMERAREMLDDQGEVTILYINFVWYEKVEELYGWQKLDDVLETTADALREFYAREHHADENIIMVSHTGDNDFILFTRIPADANAAERRLGELSRQLEQHLRQQIEDAHGEDIAALCGIYIGAGTVFQNPKIRTERLIYRGLREAAQAARSVEERERVRKVVDLKTTIAEGAVFIEYHPIIVSETEEVYGYEALARGVNRELRSPEVLFEVAEEANLVWELSRLLRKRAVAGIVSDLKEGQFLFLNIDPHDFDDPSFRNLVPEDLGIPDPSRIVLEITERTAIKDYPRFREYLDRFRSMGFRFAVDDAGSGYAGLGSIANLEPDYIKLDISLISNIESNFLKQHLVGTMVEFAETHDAMVVAEGVERPEEFETIKQLGVHLTQGFLFHKPRYAGR
ncbi:MAG TPA: EAL domain-containing protein [Longimicrobiales bacterium]|nr:EAL domain-containing protein [Longimicrobiales bacterium]